MLNEEDEKIVIDVAKLFPEAAKRVEILKDLRKSWGNVVGNLAMFSYPYNLGVNEIWIAAKNGKAIGMLNNMKGNIKNKLRERYNYEINENFEVKISEGEQKIFFRR